MNVYSHQSSPNQTPHLSTKIQQRPWHDLEVDPAQTVEQSKVAIADFSHVDLFSHAPVRSPIQAKVNMGKPNAPCEPEADRVAEQSRSMTPPSTPNLQRQDRSVQRQEAPEENLQAQFIQQRGDEIASGNISPDLASGINSTQGSGQPLEHGLQRSMRSVENRVSQLKSEIRGNAIIQRRLNERSEKIFREKMLEQMPTLPEEILIQIIEKYNPSEHIKAIKDAREHVEKIEALALGIASGESSISKASRSLVAELITAYAPEEHHYVLLGGSPAVLDAALQERKASFSHLPLGGLTDAEKQMEALEGVYEGETLRKAMLEYLKKEPNLQKYLETFLAGIKSENLVLIDYTQSGGSIIVTADLLKAITKKAVKLFTFSGKQPTEDNALVTQTDYDLVSLSPLGDNERTFVTMTDSKYYKNKIGLVAYNSLTLSILKKLPEASYESVLKQISNEEGQSKLAKL